MQFVRNSLALGGCSSSCLCFSSELKIWKSEAVCGEGTPFSQKRYANSSNLVLTQFTNLQIFVACVSLLEDYLIFLFLALIFFFFYLGGRVWVCLEMILFKISFPPCNFRLVSVFLTVQCCHGQHSGFCADSVSSEHLFSFRSKKIHLDFAELS